MIFCSILHTGQNTVSIMPPKLQVDEGFAFLFTCIEASGCKVKLHSACRSLAKFASLLGISRMLTSILQIDFKLVGDATDLQPAAARMRYTRLRKAVEAGHFKGATLTQPNTVSSSLSQIANPPSRRTTPAAVSEPQDTTRVGDHRSRDRKTSRKQSNRPIYLDDDDDEEEQEVIELPDRPPEHSRGRKRRPSTNTEAQSHNNDMFFPDTSEVSQSHKRTKHSGNGTKEGEQEASDQRRPDLSARTTMRRYLNPIIPPQAPVFNYGSTQTYTIGGRPERQSNSAHALNTTLTPELNYNSCSPPDDVSRRKQFANSAAEAAYNIGVRTGRLVTHPEKNNVLNHVVNSGHGTDPNRHLAFIGQEVHASYNQPFRRNTQPYVPVLPYQPLHPAMHNEYLHQTTSNPLPSSIITSDQNQPENQHRPTSPSRPLSRPQEKVQPAESLTQPQPELEYAAETPSRQLNTSDPNRFHPASVFKGFQAPIALSYDPSKLPNTDEKKSGKLSLLQKVRMDREKQNEQDKSRSVVHTTGNKAAVSNPCFTAPKHTMGDSRERSTTVQEAKSRADMRDIPSGDDARTHVSKSESSGEEQSGPQNRC